MSKVWCAWEEQDFDSGEFEPYRGGPLQRHLHKVPSHTTDGREIGSEAGHGPRPGYRGPDVSYGHGPMARPPRGEE